MLRARLHRALKAVHHALPEWLKQPVRPLYLGLFYYPLFPEMASTTAPMRPAPAVKEGSETAARPTMLCLPSIPWYFRMQRPQHLLRQLVARGWRVLYIDPRLDGWAYRVGRWSEACTAELAPHVTGLKLRGKRGTSFWTHPLSESEVASLARQILEATRRLRMREVTMLVHLPFWAPLALRLQREGFRLVYDCLDAHDAFAHPDNVMAAINAGEPALIRDADLVVASSGPLLDHVTPTARRAVLIPNACDPGHFAAGAPGEEIARLPRPVLGYVGALEEWFAPGMIEAVARAFPSGTVALVGRCSLALRPALSRIPNVRLLEERAYEELPALMAGFDVGLIPFHLSPLTIAADPVKFYEYMAAGLPVVSTRLPSLEPFARWVHFADTPEAFARAVAAALAEDRNAGARRAVARDHGWDARAAALERALRERVPAAAALTGAATPPAASATR